MHWLQRILFKGFQWKSATNTLEQGGGGTRLGFDAITYKALWHVAVVAQYSFMIARVWVRVSVEVLPLGPGIYLGMDYPLRKELEDADDREGAMHVLDRQQLSSKCLSLVVFIRNTHRKLYATDKKQNTMTLLMTEMKLHKEIWHGNGKVLVFFRILQGYRKLFRSGMSLRMSRSRRSSTKLMALLFRLVRMAPNRQHFHQERNWWELGIAQSVLVFNSFSSSIQWSLMNTQRLKECEILNETGRVPAAYQFAVLSSGAMPCVHYQVDGGKFGVAIDVLELFHLLSEKPFD